MRNIAKLNLSQTRMEIELILFGGVDGLDMSLYTKMQPIIDELTELVATHTDAGIEDALRGLKYEIAQNIRDRAMDIVSQRFDSVVKPEPLDNATDNPFDELLKLDI